MRDSPSENRPFALITVVRIEDRMRRRVGLRRSLPSFEGLKRCDPHAALDPLPTASRTVRTPAVRLKMIFLVEANTHSDRIRASLEASLDGYEGAARDPKTEENDSSQFARTPASLDAAHQQAR